MTFFGMGRRRRRSRKLPDLREVAAPEVDIADDLDLEVVIKLDRQNAKLSITPAPTRLLSERSRDFRSWVARLIMTTQYDYLVTSVVVANAVVIGVEQKYRLERNDQEVFGYLEAFFLTFYVAELSLNVAARGMQCFASNWVRFDTVLVTLGVFSQIMDSYVRPGESSLLSSVFLLRIARLLRLARLLRTMRLVNRFRELWMLARGLLDSMSTTFYTMIFGLLILYVVSCMTVELVPLAMQDRVGTTTSEEVEKIVRENFRTMPLTLLTLVQFITFDNIVYIYKPLIEADGTLALFFIPVLFLVGVVYMNLVTAIIVNSGLEQAVQDRDMKKKLMKAKSKRLIKELEEAFLRADTNESGTICRQELASIDLDGREFLQGILGIDDLEELFDCLDIDNVGEVGIFDFCQGVNDIVIAEVSSSAKRMERTLELTRRELKESRLAQDHLMRNVEKLMLAHGIPIVPMETLSSEVSSTERVVPDEPKMTEPELDTQEEHLRKEPAVRAKRLSKADDREMPVWAGRLLADMKQDVRVAMDEACTSFMAQVTDGTLSVQTMPWETNSRCPSEGTVVTDVDLVASAPAATVEAQFQHPVYSLPAAGWEVIPPGCQPCGRSERSRPAAPAAPARHQPEPWAGREDGGQEQRGRPPPTAAAAPTSGAAVPAACRPRLLLGPGGGAAGGSTSGWSRRQQL